MIASLIDGGVSMDEIVVHMATSVNEKCSALALRGGFGYRRPMTKDRARQIMRLLGWGPAETANRLNRVAGTRYTRQHVNTQVSPKGKRGVTDTLAVFLRMSVQVAVLSRRGARA